MTTKIGKIQKISVGFGGYQDAMLGLSVELGSDKGAWGVGDFKGYWGPEITVNKYTKWTEEDRVKAYGDTMKFIGKLLIDANKNRVDQLVGIPVEVTFDVNTLKSWRILTEAI